MRWRRPSPASAGPIGLLPMAGVTGDQNQSQASSAPQAPGPATASYRVKPGAVGNKLIRLFTRIGVCVLLMSVNLWTAGAAVGQDLSMPTAETATCQTEACHANTANSKFAHGPVAQGKCQACHAFDTPANHTFKLTRPASELCQSCHTLNHRDVIHKPVQQGRCMDCHEPHGSDHRMMLIDDPTRGLCIGCHKQEGFSDKQFKHGPVAAGACILCHEPHSSWQPKLLVEKQDTLCLTCHAQELRPKSDGAWHEHAPLKGGCTDCHDPHASDIRHQLHQDSPGLCFSCHDQMQEQLAQAPIVHGALTQAGGCLRCHAPHGSPLPKLQRAAQTELCLDCHNKPLQTADGRTLTDMAELLSDNPDHHGPIREGECSACHQPHAGERHNMLIQAYPPQFYAPFSDERYELCFGCHQAQMVKDKRGTGLTRFRDGDTNLHWLHVNREKGRTCRACHEVHASGNPFHIRDAVPFGNSDWMLEIRFEVSPAGGSCAPGCHQPRSYDRGPGRADPASNYSGESP